MVDYSETERLSSLDDMVVSPINGCRVRITATEDVHTVSMQFDIPCPISFTDGSDTFRPGGISGIIHDDMGEGSTHILRYILTLKFYYPGIIIWVIRSR